LTGLDSQIDIAKNESFVVREGDIIEMDFGAGGVEGFGIGGFGKRALGGEEFPDTRTGGARLLECRVLSDQRFHWPIH